MTAKPFIGRTQELEKLQTLYNKKSPGLVVIKGRRRIGKSRLAAEFAAKNPQSRLWNFSGLAPQDEMTAQSQRDYFARQLAGFLKIPPLTFQDWSDALEHLSLHIKNGDIVLFDEISWMGAKDSSFIPKLARRDRTCKIGHMILLSIIFTHILHKKILSFNLLSQIIFNFSIRFILQACKTSIRRNVRLPHDATQLCR